MDVKEGVHTQVQQQFAVTADKVVDETTLADLQADSLDVVELVMGLEEEFDIEITDDEAADKFNEHTTVSELCEFVTGKLDAKD